MKGQERIDTDLLRYLLRIWERRFVDGTHPDIAVIIAEKNQFMMRYGYEKLGTLVAEVECETANEMR